jgi:putative PEP-CTERM system TPR-repeat lipoprotein
MPVEGNPMPHARRRLVWHCAALAAAVLMLASPACDAAESPAPVQNADHPIAGGNLKAAEIELRNAIQESPQDPLLRSQLARVYLQLGDPISAEREARAARDRKGKEPDYLPVLLDAMALQGKFADLADLVKSGNRAPPLESKVRLALGITAAAGLHDRAKAETMLTDAVRLDPSALPPKLALARLLAATNPAEANKLVDQALALDPRSVEALLVKGELARGRGDAKEAMSQFDAAVKIDPKNVLVRLSRAGLNINQGNYNAADEDLTSVLKARPNDLMANYLHALELAKQQKYAAADHLFDRLSGFFTKFPAGYYLQGATKLALGQFAQAEDILRLYLGQFPADARAVRLAAIAALRQGAPTRAIGYLKTVVNKTPQDPQLLTLLGNAYMANGKPDLALDQFEKAAALDPGNAAIKTRVAISEIGAGQGKEGLAELERVFDTQSGATVAGPTLVLTQLRAGQVDKAAQTAAALLKRDPKSPLYQTLVGMVRGEQRDYPAAEAAFRAALTSQPGFLPARRDLAQLYLATGKAEQAKEVYNDALAKKPEDEAALLGLANIAIAEKNWSAATDNINRARTAAPNDPAPGLMLVRAYELRQDWANVKALATALSAQFPSNVDVLDAQARGQLAAGDTNGAISTYKRAHELAPNSLPILSRYLTLLNSAKYYADMRGVVQAAIANDPKNPSLKVELVRVTAELDGVDAAVSKANAFAKDDPNNNAYDLLSSQLYQNAGRYGDAAALLDKAVAARPADDALTITLARLNIRTGDFAKAEAVLNARLKADPKDVAARSVLGPLYLATSRTTDAKQVYGDLLAQKPNDVTGLLGMADVAIVQKQWPEALDAIARARSAAPNDPAPGIKLVTLYALRQDWKNATASAAELAAKFPSNVDVLDIQGRAQLGAGDTKGAIATYKHAHEVAPNSPQFLARYVAVLNAAKNYTEVRAVLQAALDRAPQNPALKGELIRVESEIGGVDAGLAKAQAFAKADPGSTLYDLVSAELLDKAGSGTQAATFIERALVAKPTDDSLTTGLARIYSHHGGANRAEALLNDRLKAVPNDFAIRATLASIYLESKNYDAAIAEYTKLLDTRPDDPGSLNNLAWLYQQKGDLTKARSLAERAVAAVPSAAQIDDTLGWILLAQGDTDKAVTYLTAANASDPSDPAIQYHLAVAFNRVGRSTDAQTMLERLLGSGATFADKTQAEKLLAELKHS